MAKNLFRIIGKNNILTSSMNMNGVASSPMGGSMKGQTMNYGGGNLNTFSMVALNPMMDSLIDQSLPKDLWGLNDLWRKIYTRDDVGGPVVDFYRDLPWGEWILGGVEDKSVLKIFQEQDDILDLQIKYPDITVDFLVMGRTVLHLIWDNKLGLFRQLIIHSPEWINLTPIPMSGAKPKIDLIPTPEIKSWANSTDPRDIYYQRMYPQELLDAFRSGKAIPLNTRNTVIVTRKAHQADFLGTSFFSRMIDYVVFQKALWNATISAAMRRPGPLTHIAVGIEGKWEPTDAELTTIAHTFLQSELDPINGVVATRQGVEVNRLSGIASDLWKIAEEDDFITRGKMRALGISESFLQGDANWATMESAINLTFERIRGLRDYLCYNVQLRGIYKELALRHQFYKVSQAELDHRVRKSVKDRELIIPTIQHVKTLKPAASEQTLTFLTTLKEQGYPVTLREFAAAAGINIDSTLDSLPEDVKIRKIIDAYQRAMPQPAEGEEDRGFNVNHADHSLADLNQKILDFQRDEKVKPDLDIAIKPGSRTPKKAEHLLSGDISPQEENRMKKYIK